jgi:predicted O-linked N-acetylglucosamine transferase (SPINDLY family)
MPNSFWPTDDTLKKSERVFRRDEFGFEENCFVFSCFSVSKKIQKKEFLIWMNLLLKRKNSVLWLREPNELAKSNMLLEAQKNGVDSSRIIFAKPINLREHMSRQLCADLALDTFNVSSGTMAFIALQIGLPILTMPGRSYTSRSTSSILKSLGLNNLICSNIDDYEKKALDLSESREKTLSIRKQILESQKTSAYFNSQTYCKDLENNYKKIISYFKNKNN